MNIESNLIDISQPKNSAFINIDHSNKNVNDTSQQSSNTDTSVNNECQPNKLNQIAITKIKENHPFGNIFNTNKPLNTVRIYLKNINGIKSYNKWSNWDNACSILKEYNVDIFGITESNINWNTKHRMEARNIAQKQGNFNSAQIATSSNIESSLTNYQPGGTATVITNKWTGRITKQINDTSGMGRWSGFKLQTNTDSCLNILTVYRPNTSQGIHTCYQQQMNAIKNSGKTNPDPRQQLLDDLSSTFYQFNKLNNKTIILIDANEGLFSNKSKISLFLSQTNLTSLIQHPQHYPPTHIRGTRCIDYIFGTPSLLQHIVQSGITPFYEAPWIHTDHRGLFIELQELGLFGATTHSLIPPPEKRITSRSRKMIHKFIDELEITNILPIIMNKLKTLENTSIWTQQQHSQLEEMDILFTTTLLDAEQKAALPSQHPWSVELDQASSLYSYWLLKVTGNTNQIIVTQQLDTIAKKLKTIDIYQTDPSRIPLLQMRLARKNLINCRIDSESKRDKQLNIEVLFAEILC
jgi:hypothetical protein